MVTLFPPASDGDKATLGAVAVYGEDSGCQDFAPNLNSCDPMISIVEYGRLWHTVNDERQLCPVAGWFRQMRLDGTLRFLGNEYDIN